MPKVSFLVPVYNVEKYLSQCIDSMRGQSLEDWECVLVDDGSTDSSGAICDEYAQKDPRVRVIHKQNTGASAARNTALEAASGDWIYYVDSDDWLQPDAAEELVRFAEENQLDCVMSYAMRHFEGGKEHTGRLFSQSFFALDEESIGLVQKYILYRPYSPYYSAEAVNGYAAPWSKLVRRSILMENGVRFDTEVFDIFEDGLWSLWMLEHVKRFAYLDKQTYNYRISSSSLIHSFKENAMEIQEAGYAKVEEWLTRTEKDTSFWEAYYAHVVSFFGGHLSRYFYHPKRGKTNAEVAREIRAYLKRDPFYTAAHKVDTSKLLKKDKLLAFSQKHCLVAGLRAYLLARNGYRKKVTE